MAKLTAKEKQRVKTEVRQMLGPKNRGNTWVGTRPVIFGDKRRKKQAKAINKLIKEEREYG